MEIMEWWNEWNEVSREGHDRKRKYIFNVANATNVENVANATNVES